VRNIGTGPADGFAVYWYPTATGQAVPTTVGGLAPGASVDVGFDAPYTAAGQFDSVVQVDALHEVAESNEDNNSAVQRISVRPPVPQKDQNEFEVNVHADPGVFLGSCVQIQDDPQSRFPLPEGWRIDKDRGDAGHPGISEIAVKDNSQSKSSLRGYNYQATSDVLVQISGRICGSGGMGAGAIFDRFYRVFLVRA
jgi:hypothetical protein